MEYLVRGLNLNISQSPPSPLNIWRGISAVCTEIEKASVEPYKGSSFQVRGSIFGTPRYVVGVLGEFDSDTLG